jgi:hypothetical protein
VKPLGRVLRLMANWLASLEGHQGLPRHPIDKTTWVGGWLVRKFQIAAPRTRSDHDAGLEGEVTDIEAIIKRGQRVNCRASRGRLSPTRCPDTPGRLESD